MKWAKIEVFLLYIILNRENLFDETNFKKQYIISRLSLEYSQKSLICAIKDYCCLPKIKHP